MTTRKAPEFLTGSGVEVVPALLPAELGEVFAGDIWLEEITLTNTTDATVTVTVQDKQTVPRAVLSQVPIGARTTYVVRFGARYCPGGVSWVASAADSIVGYMRGRRS